MSRREVGFRTGKRSLALLLLVSVAATVASLGTVLSAYAMPVEARTTEAWYKYGSAVGFTYVARVQSGKYYDHTIMQPDQLASVRLPVEPPVFRRVLLTKFTEVIEISIPWSFQADREARGEGRLRIDGLLQVPNTWVRSYPFGERTLALNGTELSGTERFTIPLAPFLADIEEARKEHNLGLEPFEIYIRPSLELNVQGLAKPLRVTNAQEYRITIRTNTVEIDDNADGREDEVLTETRVTPITVSIAGRPVTVALLRQISLYSLVTFLVLASVLMLLRRQKPNHSQVLAKLGPNLIVVSAFEPPADAATADVATAKELLQLHLQTERPVIKAGSAYYLLDGATCYRFMLPAGGSS